MIVSPSTPALSERIRVRAKFFFQGEHKWFLKGITYGPFKPDAKGDFVGDPDKLRADLALMDGLGVNTLRIYHVPPRWFLDIIAEHGLRALISIPWAEHVEFLNDRPIRAEVLKTVRAAVAEHRGHPAILGYLVGNEIPTTMVRWLGVQRVTEFIEELINVGRSIDPDALFSYASYPPTEFLLPQNVDFYTFNVYLHKTVRVRKLSAATAKPRRRPPAHHGRVRHGHRASHGNRARRDADLAR